jgi:hypothetical protein
MIPDKTHEEKYYHYPEETQHSHKYVLSLTHSRMCSTENRIVRLYRVVVTFTFITTY